jgi:hypothetical protein
MAGISPVSTQRRRFDGLIGAPRCVASPFTWRVFSSSMNFSFFRRRQPAHFLLGRPPRRSLPLLAGTAALALGLFPQLGWGCACGCGISEVGTSEIFPSGANTMAFFEADTQDQNRNWDGASPAPGAHNPDKDLRTTFLIAGIQEMVNRSWGIQAELPYVTRHFQTTGGPSGDDLVAFNWSGPGDMRIEGLYTGFSADMSTGLIFGLKLPTGDYTHNDAFGDIDRDSEFGSGSTDLILGGFQREPLANAPGWIWFAQASVDLPLLTRDQYRPGREIDAALGIYYTRWSLGRLKLAPMAQLKAADRSSDRGANASNPVASGYARLLAAPGIEFSLRPITVYADVELPVIQRFTGNQLASAMIGKVSVSYRF